MAEAVINKYDQKGNASQYDDHRISTIIQLERIWGTRNTMIWCEMTAFKYRSRMGKKDSLEKEMVKINWYEFMASHLKDKIGTEEEIKELPEDKCKNPFRE